MKKWIAILVVVMLVAAGVYLWFFPRVELTLNGEAELTLNYKDLYTEQGAKGTVFGFETGEVEITGEVDTSVLGDYTVQYTYAFGNKTLQLVRTIRVRDLEAPVMTVTDPHILYIKQEQEIRQYPSVTAVDNYDGDVSGKIVTDSFDNDHIGMHFVLREVTDSNGNTASVVQPVEVREDYEGVDKSKLPVTIQPGLYNMKVENDLLYMMGYDTGEGSHEIAFVSDAEYLFSVSNPDVTDDGYFAGWVDVASLKDGTYEVYDLFGGTKYPLVDKNIIEACRLGRWHIKDKLVTFDYTGNTLQVTVEPFVYLYDIAIDVGHGDDDIGASGLGTYERELNLKVSLYEKKRFEQHGLKVWLIRDSEDYGPLLGDKSWTMIQRVGYTWGWYGAVSRYSYSNHHNSDTWGTYGGFEIIVLPDRTNETEYPEYQVFKDFKKLYELQNNKYQYYSRSYHSGKRLDRKDGKIYENERVWYGNMRYALESFGVETVTYEA
ncbi:MAG: DUF5011 domain-containing protein, partial [Erysipelotrichaceae bacterium]|nr:DUF5011 domain-containing protein [Erysipelotrichaceae bacterium]